MQIASTAQALINVAAGLVTKETELNASVSITHTEETREKENTLFPLYIVSLDLTGLLYSSNHSLLLQLTAPVMEWYVTNMAHAYQRPLEDAIDSAFVWLAGKGMDEDVMVTH